MPAIVFFVAIMLANSFWIFTTASCERRCCMVMACARLRRLENSSMLPFIASTCNQRRWRRFSSTLSLRVSHCSSCFGVDRESRAVSAPLTRFWKGFFFSLLRLRCLALLTAGRRVRDPRGEPSSKLLVGEFCDAANRLFTASKRSEQAVRQLIIFKAFSNKTR